MRTKIVIAFLLCGLIFSTNLYAFAQDEATPEPAIEATVEAAADEAQSDETIANEAAQAGEAAEDTADTEEEDAEDDEESEASGTGLLILLIGMGGILAVGGVMIGRSNSAGGDTTT